MMNIFYTVFGSLLIVFGCFCLDRYINQKRDLLLLELAAIGLINGFYVIGMTF